MLGLSYTETQRSLATKTEEVRRLEASLKARKVEVEAELSYLKTNESECTEVGEGVKEENRQLRD